MPWTTLLASETQSQKKPRDPQKGSVPGTRIQQGPSCLSSTCILWGVAATSSPPEGAARAPMCEHTCHPTRTCTSTHMSKHRRTCTKNSVCHIPKSSETLHGASLRSTAGEGDQLPSHHSQSYPRSCRYSPCWTPHHILWKSTWLGKGTVVYTCNPRDKAEAGGS